MENIKLIYDYYKPIADIKLEELLPLEGKIKEVQFNPDEVFFFKVSITSRQFLLKADY